MKKKRKKPARRVARNLIVPIMLEDGTYDMTQEALSSLISLIMEKNEEMMLTYKIFTGVGALTENEMKTARRYGKRANQYYEEARNAWLDYRRSIAMRLFADAFEDIRKIINKLNEFGMRAQYFMPNFYYVQHVVDVPEPTMEEIQNLSRLGIAKANVWKHYWLYVKNIGFAFDQHADWYYRAIVAEAFGFLNEAITFYTSGEANIHELRGAFLTAIYYIDEVTNQLWDFTDPKGEGAKGLPNWTWAAYYDIMKEKMEKRQPLGSVREILPAVQQRSILAGYLEPGGEPPPPPPTDFSRFEFLG